jgi:hypothetical protein
VNQEIGVSRRGHGFTLRGKGDWTPTKIALDPPYRMLQIPCRHTVADHLKQEPALRDAGWPPPPPFPASSWLLGWGKFQSGWGLLQTACSNRLHFTGFFGNEPSLGCPRRPSTAHEITFVWVSRQSSCCTVGVDRLES